MFEISAPAPGEGWGRLLTTPLYNGGDEYPEGLAALVDSAVGESPSVGLKAYGEPSVLFTFQPVVRVDGVEERIVHWASDGRVPLKASLDLLSAVVAGQPGVRFLAFVRRPALVRLLASRGWTLRTHEDDPFLALMVCQQGEGAGAQ